MFNFDCLRDEASATSVVFPTPFQSYRPATSKVYGAVCMSLSNRVLIVKGRRSGKWSFPKGHKLRAEAYLDCAVRETWEETGIDLRGERQVLPCQRLSAGVYYFFQMEEEIEPVVQDSTEVEEAGWFSLEEMRAMPCNVDVNNFLERLKRNARRMRAGRDPWPTVSMAAADAAGELVPVEAAATA